MPANSFSLHIGINGVDKNHYRGWDGKLQGCENDALFYHQLAQKEGCNISKLLLTSDQANSPTTGNVLAFLDYSISTLDSGDKLIITYSGHGGVLEDKNYDEADFQDETWCLYDRQLLDDELFARFSRFRPGVNIFLISDSCHSGSISKSTTDDVSQDAQPDTRLRRFVPRDKLFDTFQANRAIYEPFMRMPLIRDEDIHAAVLQLGACQDDEYAMEDGDNGLFTKTIMKILERNGDISSYQELLVRSKRALGGIQKPNLVGYGNNHKELIKVKPFGSSYITGTPLRINMFNDSGALIVETSGVHESLTALKQFIVSQTLAVPEKVDHVVYHCSCSLEEPGMYPWDHAYSQYRYLKGAGFPVCCVVPQLPDSTDSIINDALDDKSVPMDTIFQKLFKGKIKQSRGLGLVIEAEDDEVLIKMFSLETVQVLFRDEDLQTYRQMAPSALEVYLADPENYKAFVTILKNSIYSSDTLTVHL